MVADRMEQRQNLSRSESNSAATENPSFFKKLFCRGATQRKGKRYRKVVSNLVFSGSHSSRSHPHHGYANNRIRTTKYTFLSFIPKNLFEQFHRFANLYFLGIVLLNWLPQINAFGKEVAMIPVVFVLGVTAVKDAFEDHRRYLSDKRVNNLTCRVYSREDSRYVKTLWKHVQVGDIVHLSCNEVIPADILLLRSSDDQGLCFIETANLDGESNLKQRHVVRGYAAMRDTFHPTHFNSTIECDPPNNKIHRFTGYIIHPNNEKVPVNKENLLLRDCVVKNTDFVEGIVVYAGHETKTMLNNGGPRYKRSKLERIMNRDVIWCIVILVVLCFVGATGSGLWLSSYEQRENVYFIPYEHKYRFNPTVDGVIQFWTFVIILQVMIPISLYVTIELIKLGQVFHIHHDVELYDEHSNKRVECRALNITEELGQLQFVFSDKTGTLTENNMIFRRCTIGGVDYNHHTPAVEDDITAYEDVDQWKKSEVNPKHNLSFILNPRLQEELAKMEIQLAMGPNLHRQMSLSTESQRIQDFFLLMAVCNTVVVSKHPHKDQMNSSGLCLNASYFSASSIPVTLGTNTCTDSNQQPRYTRLVDTFDTPPGSGPSTPLQRPQYLPISNSSRTATPTPTPVSPEFHPIYEAESPDEIALVNAAFLYNCRLLKRTPDCAVIALPGEGLLEFKILHVLPFDANRKCMSVILEHPFTKEKVLYCKGADSAILPLLAPVNQQETKELITKTHQHLNNYSKKGLRILCMAKKVLSPEEYDEWVGLHKEAEMALDDREQLIHDSACYIEQNMELLGATGIEDRLQEGVPECIASIRAAGMVVWVLTGDKQETAVNIAYSCQLFSTDMEVLTLNARSKEAAEDTIRFYLDQISKEVVTRDTGSPVPSVLMSRSSLLYGNFLFGKYNNSNSPINRCNSHRRNKRALVIDGRTLAFILDKNIDSLFVELAQYCSAVLCCRTTPLQKASIVKLIKEKLSVMTLAIGDGANDVSMIQKADIGIGISGQEGMQAVMASDFAVTRFRHLERLLLVHGHWCYDRLARTVLYFFYKNASFIFVIFWYQIYCGFSGMVMIDQLYLMLFNVFFTALPPLVLGIYDQDCPASILLQKPTLYAQGRRSKVYTKYSFWVNMLDALYQSVIIFFVPLLVFYDSNVGIWEFGSTIITACVLVQLAHIAIETRSWTYLHILATFLSIAVYFGFAVLYNALCLGSSSLQNSYWVMQHVMATAPYWFTVVLVLVIACLPRFVVRTIQNSLSPCNVTTALQEIKYPKQASEKCSVSASWSRGSSGSSSVTFRHTGSHVIVQEDNRSEVNSVPNMCDTSLKDTDVVT
ncbi:phospholipid-transporting ATPase VA isoform X1 [Tachypleus tridentatus]|uniref:phospholipid-transporting ATPase VA isoform X1 n=1 Tax=Tachypleus tridentatus TaxID=6853 RepID=UPI003FD31ADA